MSSDFWLKLDSLTRQEQLQLVSSLIDGTDWKIPSKGIRQVPDQGILPQMDLPTLRQGVRSNLVGDVQKFLLGEGFEITVDDQFGPATEQVLREYQLSRGIEADGIVGPQTWGRLLSENFRPYEGFVEDEQAYDRSGDSRYGPHWPPKPPGATSPNGRILFGQDFTFTPQPLPRMPEYVKPDPAWVRKQITTATIPQLVGVEGARADGTMLIHRKLQKQVEVLFDLWEQMGLADRVLTFSGSWVPRFIRGRTDRLSNHSFGSAFDINAAWNGFRKMPALFGKRGCVRELVQPAYSMGFYWGGWYNDGMHFEAHSVLSEAEMDEVMETYLG